jgi:hypothetical protein
VISLKDEIKEINITFPGQILDYVDTKEHLLELFNYITNLQEEYEIELDENNKLSEWLVQKQKKIDKVRDKIQYIIDYGFDYDGFNTVESLKGLIDMLVDYAKQSKDILNEDDK